MNLFKVCGAGLLAAVAAGCWSHDTGGTAVTPDIVAGLRYVNLVSDTSALNFRVVDVINNAPNSINAVFRTGGNPYGVTTTFLPPYMPVDAGTRHIKVFMYSTVDTIATKVVLDTTFTFVQNTNYTFYLYGYARSGSTPQISALITTDAVPTIATGKFVMRVLNLAPTLSGNPIGSAATAIDARVGLDTSAVPLPVAAGTPVVGTNLAFGQMSTYTAVDVSGTSVPYRLAAMAASASSPIMFQANMPVGVAGTSTANPIGGTAVAGTAITAILVPQSVAGSKAPQDTAALVTTGIDSLTRSSDVVTVWRSITAGSATACATPVATGASANDIIHVSGLNQPEYNGSHSVAGVTAGRAQTLFSQRTITLAGGTGAFTVTFGGATSAAIAFDATAQAVEQALGAMSSIGAANVSVTGAVGGPYTVLFMGSFAGTTVGTMTAAGAAGLTATVSTPAVGCAGPTNPLQTTDTVTFGGAIVATDSFRVTVAGQTTAYMSVAADSATIRARIAALSSVGADSNVSVTGATGGPYAFTFKGALKNQNVAFSAALKAPTTATVAVAKAAFTFTGVATPSRFIFRIAGTPASLATGTPQFRIVTATNEYRAPTILFILDNRPPQTAP